MNLNNYFYDAAYAYRIDQEELSIVESEDRIEGSFRLTQSEIPDLIATLKVWQGKERIQEELSYSRPCEDKALNELKRLFPTINFRVMDRGEDFSQCSVCFPEGFDETPFWEAIGENDSTEEPTFGKSLSYFLILK